MCIKQLACINYHKGFERSVLLGEDGSQSWRIKEWVDSKVACAKDPSE